MCNGTKKILQNLCHSGEKIEDTLIQKGQKSKRKILKERIKSFNEFDNPKPIINKLSRLIVSKKFNPSPFYERF